MGKYYQLKPKAYKNSKTQCPCGGFYTDAVYTGDYANINPKINHEKTKMHQDYVNNGNKMSSGVKAKLEKAAAKEKEEREAAKEEREAALAEKRKTQTLCGCGSYYNNNTEDRHFDTAKHSKWAAKNY